MPEGANDVGFAMTSSFTCMTLATWLTMRCSTADDGLAGRLAAATEEVLTAQSSAAQALAQRGYERVVYLGSGPLTGLARESALKLLELTAGGVIAYSNSALGFRHGPKAVLDNRTLALVYLSNDPYTRQYDLDIAAELRAALDPESVVVISAGGAGDGEPWHIEGLGDVDDVALAPALRGVRPAARSALLPGFGQNTRQSLPLWDGEPRRSGRDHPRSGAVNRRPRWPPP